MREFGFELRLCAHLEAAGALVARQLGASIRRPGGRVVDVLVVEPGPGFDERRAITPEAIPDLAIEADVGVGRARSRRRLVRDLDVHPDTARDVLDRAVEVGFFARERRGSQETLRQAARYPGDWFGRLVAIENKPDLGSPGDLEAQLRADVALGLVDEVVLATRSYVTRAHLNRIPEEVGVWRFAAGDPVDGGAPARSGRGDAGSGDRAGDRRSDDGEVGGGRLSDALSRRRDRPGAVVGIEVLREPTPLPVGEPGIEIVDERAGRTDVRFVGPDEKARQRRRMAERAYGKGWRTFDHPACANALAGAVAGVGGLPHCRFHGRLVEPAAECGPACPGFEAGEPPAVVLSEERDRTSPWVADPTGPSRRQSGLDRFL